MGKEENNKMGKVILYLVLGSIILILLDIQNINFNLSIIFWGPVFGSLLGVMGAFKISQYSIKETKKENLEKEEKEAIQKDKEMIFSLFNKGLIRRATIWLFIPDNEINSSAKNLNTKYIYYAEKMIQKEDISNIESFLKLKETEEKNKKIFDKARENVYDMYLLKEDIELINMYCISLTYKKFFNEFLNKTKINGVKNPIKFFNQNGHEYANKLKKIKTQKEYEDLIREIRAKYLMEIREIYKGI